MDHPLHTASGNPIPGPDPSGSGEQRDWGPQPAYARSPLPPPAAHGQMTAPTGGAALPAPVPPPASATAPLSIATPTTLTGPAATTTRRGEPSAFGIAAGLAALVLVGGISFAAGRWSVDEDAGVAGGGGSLAIGAAGAQAQGPGARAEAQSQGPGARADRFTNGSRDAAGVADDTFGGSTADIGTDDAAPAAAGANAGAGADGVQEPDDAGGPEGGPPAGARGGLAPGNIEGTVASLSSDSIGILDLTGATVELEIDDTTEMVIEMFDEVASLAPGELVQVALAQPVAAGDTANESFEAGLAGTVTVLPPGSELGDEPRGGFAAGERPGADAERDGAAGGARQGARRGGSRRAALQGEIIAVDASGLTLELPSGETRSVTLDPATEVRRQADAAFAELGIDQRVRATVARGGFGQDADQGTGGLTTAARIVLLDAVATP